MKKPDCQARQYGDQYLCDRCRRQWDVKDDDPPPCQPVNQIATEALQKIRETLKS